MTIAPGTSVGPYLVESLLGAGGMGEVYRAQDARLGRAVALKILPAVFGVDSDRVRRFEQEARAAATLSHPGIVAIHDVGQHDGTFFLVSELLEGETLRQRLSGRPLPAATAIDYAIQIAEALSAAHDKGIVHRDLKPENLFVTRGDRIKILDFGLARVRPAVTQDGSTALAAQVPGTEAGMVLGTAGYMSPEQVRGDAADHRADIFALGAILYEMLGGRRPFERDSAVETMAAILGDEPPELPPLQASGAAVLERIVRRCLAKRPERRFESAADLAFALQTLGSGLTLTHAAMPRASAPPWKWLAVAAALILVAAIAWWAASPAPPGAPEAAQVRRLAIVLPPGEAIGLSGASPLADGRTSIALSPDGATLAFIVERDGRSELAVRQLDRFELVRLPGTEGAYNPFFSPDGTAVAFFSGTTLNRVSLRGGEPATICEARNAFGGIWLPDDTIVFGNQEGGQIVRVSARGGTPQVILSAPRPSFLPYSALPDGKHVLIGTWGFGSNDYTVLEAVNIDNGERRPVLEGGTHPVYAPTGHLLFLRGGALHAAPFDVSRLTFTGPQVPVLNGIRTEQSGPGQFALARDGTLAYVAGGAAAIGTPVWVDRNGSATPVGMPVATYGQARLSPDGQRIAVTMRGVGSDIYVYDVARGTLTRLTQDGQSDLATWTADGTHITHMTDTERGPSIVTRPADGSSPAELVWSGTSEVPWSWAPDGSALAVQCGEDGNDICLLDMAGQARLRTIASTPFAEWGAAFSPSGQWIAYTSDASGRYEVYVRPSGESARQWQISTAGGEEPVWSRDGRELFYRYGLRWMAVSIGEGPAFTAGQPRLLFEGAFQNLSGFSYDVAPDGQRFLMVQEPQMGSATQIHVVLNWFEELRRLTASR